MEEARSLSWLDSRSCAAVHLRRAIMWIALGRMQLRMMRIHQRLRWQTRYDSLALVAASCSTREPEQPSCPGSCEPDLPHRLLRRRGSPAPLTMET